MHTPMPELKNITWYDVVVKHTHAQRAIEIKNEIIADGLVQGIDFEWRWTGSSWDNMTGSLPSQTKFSFREEKLAVFYKLKWK